MNENIEMEAGEESCRVCSVEDDDLKSAVLSWLTPLSALAFLIGSYHYPVVSVLNVFFAAFGVAALLRSVARIRAYGHYGLGGHLAMGVVLNLAVVTLILIYIFTLLDPLHIRA
jgi:hypothetical protein